MTKGKSTPKRKPGTRAKYVPANLVDHGENARRAKGPEEQRRIREAGRGKTGDGRTRVVFE